jgi:hypothetical protein
MPTVLANRCGLALEFGFARFLAATDQQPKTAGTYYKKCTANLP